MREKRRTRAPRVNWTMGILTEIGAAAALLALGAAISILLARGVR